MRKRTLVIGGIAVVAAISFASCSGNATPTTTGPASAPSSVAVDDERNQLELKPGEAIQVGDLEVTAAELKPGQSLGSTKTLCTNVAYQNTGDAVERFSLVDWKLQDPNGAALTAGIIGASGTPLSTGELAAKGKTSGPVCFTDPGLEGTYRIVYSPMFGGDRAEWVVQR